jgi:hypothetical protein
MSFRCPSCPACQQWPARRMKINRERDVGITTAQLNDRVTLGDGARCVCVLMRVLWWVSGKGRVGRMHSNSMNCTSTHWADGKEQSPKHKGGGAARGEDTAESHHTIRSRSSVAWHPRVLTVRQPPPPPQLTPQIKQINGYSHYTVDFWPKSERWRQAPCTLQSLPTRWESATKKQSSRGHVAVMSGPRKGGCVWAYHRPHSGVGGKGRMG